MSGELIPARPRLAWPAVPEADWLGSWTPVEPPPVPADDIRRDIARLERVLQPARSREIGTLLDRLQPLFGPAPDGTDDDYLDVLSDLPAIAIALAVRACIAECTFYPLPAEIRRRVPSEYGDCRHKLRRLRTALMVSEHAEADRQQPRGPDRAGTAAELAKEIAATAERLTVTNEPDDEPERSAEAIAAGMRRALEELKNHEPIPLPTPFIPTASYAAAEAALQRRHPKPPKPEEEQS